MIDRLEKRLFGACLLALAAAPAAAGDGPPRPYQDVQILQSGLAVLDYYDGPIHGDLDTDTLLSIEYFALQTGFDGRVDAVTPELLTAVEAAATPALAAAFGTDPSGSWDRDLSQLGPQEAQALMDLYQWPSLELCGSPLAIRFQGMAYGTWLYGFVGPIALRDGALQPLPDRDYPDMVQPAFTFVDQDTMQRVVEGETETWHRCD